MLGRPAAVYGLAAILLGCSASATSTPEGPPTGHSAASVPTAAGSRPPPSRAPAPAVASSPTRPATRDPAVVAARATVPVLCYHQVRPWTSADGPDTRSLTTPLERFEEQMRLLDRKGYTPVTLEQMYGHLTRGAPLPAKPVLLTFDDGHASQFTNAARVLRRHRFRAAFFPMTVVLGNDGWMTRAQVRELHRRGMSIGAHTWDHSPVTRYAGGDWARQLEEPARELAEITGVRPRWLAYPYGGWKPEVLDRVAAAGYDAAWQLADRPMHGTRPLLSLRRHLVDGRWTLAEFERHLTPA